MRSSSPASSVVYLDINVLRNPFMAIPTTVIANKQPKLPWKSENNVLNLLSKWITYMPTVKTIDDIKINIYSRDHLSPHVHSEFAKYEEPTVIEKLETYVG